IWFCERRKALLQDIAIVTGVEYQANDLGLLVENASVEQHNPQRLPHMKGLSISKLKSPGRLVGLSGPKFDLLFSAGTVPGLGAAFVHLSTLVPAIKEKIEDAEERLGADIIQIIQKVLTTQAIIVERAQPKTPDAAGCNKRVLRIFLENLPEHPSDTKVFTMKMEILLEPTSNKLLDVVAEVEEDEDEDDNEVPAAPSPPTPATTSSPQQALIPSPPQAESAQPSSPPQQQPSQTADISESLMTLLNKLMETCATLTKKVTNLEQDKIAQALEITKLKQRVGKLEKKRKFKRGGIDELDANEDVTLVDIDAEVAMDANIQRRMAESQAKVYNLDLQHYEKVLSMQDTDEAEPAEVEEVLEYQWLVLQGKKGVVIQDPEETATTSVIVHSEVKSKDKGKGILIKEPKPLKGQAQIDMDETFARYEIKPIFEKHYNSIQAFLKKEENEIEEEGSKRKANDDDDVYTEVTPLASKPKNFSDDFLLNTLKIMFEKPNVEASVWRDQKGRYGLAKVKSWKLFESYRVHIITLITTQMILMVEKKYPLTHFTLEQMLNSVRLEVEEDSKMSLELLRLVRRQLNEGYVPE
nr:RuBisCO large subunit-binding protein subunit alpha [Tanacetum cinerariifolium]